MTQPRALFSPDERDNVLYDTAMEVRGVHVKLDSHMDYVRLALEKLEKSIESSNKCIIEEIEDDKDDLDNLKRDLTRLGVGAVALIITSGLTIWGIIEAF